MKSRKMRILSLSLALLCAGLVSGQSHQAELSEIKSDGLYKVLLPANVRSASANNLNYLRVKDGTGNSVPYIIMDAEVREYAQFKTLEIISKQSFKDSVSSFIFLNQASLKNSLTLRITNTSIDKEYTLYGSDNQEDWFGLIAQKKMQLNGSSSKTYLEERINLPLNTYHFLKLDLNDKSSLPIQVEAIGVYENQYFPSKMLPLDVFSSTEPIQGENKTSQIVFTAAQSYQVDAISFKVKNEFYQREASIVVEKEREVKRQIEKYEEIQHRFVLSSDASNTIALNNTYLKEFSLKINNEDNPALDFEEIKFYQKPKYLVSYLKAGQDYTFIINDGLDKPNYDLAHFVAKNITDLKEAQIINLRELQDNNTAVADEKEVKSFWESKLFMWLAIALGGILVIYFAISMLRDMGRS